MLKPTSALVGAAMILSACAQPKVWGQPGMTRWDFERDAAICRDYVRTTTPPSFAIGGALFLAAVAISQHNAAQNSYDDCMIEHGYRAKQ